MSTEEQVFVQSRPMNMERVDKGCGNTLVIEINDREIRLDETEGVLAWTDVDHLVWLAMDFIRRCPVEARTGLPWYLAYSCFWTDPLRPTDWPDNPAGKFAMAVETLIRYYAYSGETWFHEPVRTMLDRLIAYHTPEHFAWPDRRQRLGYAAPARHPQ